MRAADISVYKAGPVVLAQEAESCSGWSPKRGGVGGEGP